MKNTIKTFLVVAVSLSFLPLSSFGQSGGKTPSQILGVFTYPEKKQTQEQLSKDEAACYASAKQETGIDPATLKDPKQDDDKHAFGIRGRRKEKKEKKQDQQIEQAQKQSMDTVRRAFSACMGARGYSVK